MLTFVLTVQKQRWVTQLMPLHELVVHSSLAHRVKSLRNVLAAAVQIILLNLKRQVCLFHVWCNEIGSIQCSASANRGRAFVWVEFVRLTYFHGAPFSLKRTADELWLFWVGYLVGIFLKAIKWTLPLQENQWTVFVTHDKSCMGRESSLQSERWTNGF